MFFFGKRETLVRPSVWFIFSGWIDFLKFPICKLWVANAEWIYLSFQGKKKKKM